MPKASQTRRQKQKQSEDSASNQVPQTSADGTVAESAPPRRRIQEMSPRMRLLSLIVGDIICFLIFASLGTQAHGKGVNIFESISVAVPFLAAWFLVSPFVGAFRADIATRPTKMLLRTALSWLATWPVAMAFRWLLVERANPVAPGSFLSFAIVVLISNLVILSVWRGPFALNNSLRKRGV